MIGYWHNPVVRLSGSMSAVLLWFSNLLNFTLMDTIWATTTVTSTSIATIEKRDILFHPSTQHTPDCRITNNVGGRWTSGWLCSLRASTSNKTGRAQERCMSHSQTGRERQTGFRLSCVGRLAVQKGIGGAATISANTPTVVTTY